MDILISDNKRETASLSPLNVMFTVGFSVPFDQVEEVHFYS